jgi:outer membrane receptor for ferrienterochelin and colicins
LIFRNFIISFSLVLFWVGLLPAQNILFITDSQTGAALFGAHVTYWQPGEAGKPKYAVTDNHGRVSVPFSDSYRIAVSFVGYKPLDTLLYQGNHTLSLHLVQTLLKPVELVSDFIPRGEEAMVNPVTVIDRDRIEKQGAQNLRDLLTQNLNIRLSQDNVLGASVALQGVGGENVKIMIDGVPVIGRLDGKIDLSQLNLNNIERVEIIQGPASTAYGTNALGGIINLITKKEIASSLEFGGTGYYESVGQYNADGFLSARFGKHSIRLNGGRYFFDGFNSLPDSARFMQWKPKRQAFGEAQYVFRWKELQLRWAGSWFSEKIENKGRPLAPFGIAARDGYYLTDRIANTLSLTGYVKPKHHVDFTANYSLFYRKVDTYFKDLVTLESNLLQSDRDRFTLFMSRGIYTYSGASQKVMLQAGYDLNFETGSGPRIKSGIQNIGDYAAFFSAEYTAWKRLTLKPSFRYGYNSRFRMPFIPAFSFKMQAHKYVQIRGAYSRGFRAPDLKELFFEFVDINHNIVGNENLSAENSHNITGSVTFKMNKKEYAFLFEPAGFYNDINNRITLIYTGGLSENGVPVYTNRNVGRFKTAGVRLNLQFAYKSLQVQGGVAYTGISQTFDGSIGNTSRFLVSPEVRGALGYTYEKWGLSGNVFYKYNGRMPFLFSNENDQIVQGFIQGFHTLDVSVTKTFFKKNLRLSMFGKNLFNVHNLIQNGTLPDGGVHAGSSGPISAAWGRTVAVAVSYQFGWTKKSNP